MGYKLRLKKANLTTGFIKVTTTGNYAATLDAFEAELLASLASQLIEILDVPPGNDLADQLSEVFDQALPEIPADPVLQRLLPTGATDPTAAVEFRRHTERSLRINKTETAQLLLSGLAEAGFVIDADESQVYDLSLTKPQAQLWLRGLNDLRLAIGARLGIDRSGEPGDEELPDPAHLAGMYEVYEWLGFLQDSLIQALT